MSTIGVDSEELLAAIRPFLEAAEFIDDRSPYRSLMLANAQIRTCHYTKIVKFAEKHFGKSTK